MKKKQIALLLAALLCVSPVAESMAVMGAEFSSGEDSEAQNAEKETLLKETADEAVDIDEPENTEEIWTSGEEEVAEFELYKINNVESALGLDDAYDRVMATIETIPDVYKQRGFRTRVKKKYDLMNAVIDKVWTKAITEYQEKEQEKRNKQMQIDADEAETQGKATLRSNRIDAVEWYIDKLNGRHYYNKLTKRLIKDAEAKLSRCEGYSVYEDLSERLNSVITYCKGLPKAPESNDIPSNSSDYETDTDRNNKYPDDTQATEPPKTTVAPSNNGMNEDQSTTEVQ